MLMMRPHFLAIMLGRTRRVVWNAALRLMAMMASHLATGNSCRGATCWMPALFTRMSRLPSFSSVILTISAIDWGFDMSAVESATGTPKSDPMADWVASISSGLPKPLRTTAEPAAASARAIPRPMPLVEPVTKDTLSLSGCAAATPRSVMAMFMGRTLRAGSTVFRSWPPASFTADHTHRAAAHEKCPLATEFNRGALWPV